MNIIKIEQASRFSWPALEEQELPIGIFRYTAEANHCSSSLEPNLEIRIDPDELIAQTEVFFAEKNLPPTVRLREGSPQISSLDQSLSLAGYDLDAHFSVMVLSLDPYEAESHSGADKDWHYSHLNDWVRAWHCLRKRDQRLSLIHRVSLARVTDPCCFLLFQDHLSRPVASGFAVLYKGALGIHGIATSKQSRRKGYATRAVNQLLQWGKRNGAEWAYLHVDSLNIAAFNLYTKLGFSKMYKYWYRVRH